MLKRNLRFLNSSLKTFCPTFIKTNTNPLVVLSFLFLFNFLFVLCVLLLFFSFWFVWLCFNYGCNIFAHVVIITNQYVPPARPHGCSQAFHSCIPPNIWVSPEGGITCPGRGTGGVKERKNKALSCQNPSQGDKDLCLALKNIKRTAWFWYHCIMMISDEREWSFFLQPKRHNIRRVD